jgi:hypothetical protein
MRASPAGQVVRFGSWAVSVADTQSGQVRIARDLQRAQSGASRGVRSCDNKLVVASDTRRPNS